MDTKERLIVTRHEDGTVEWCMERPIFSVHDLLPSALLGGMTAWALLRYGSPWEQAAPLGAATVLAVLLLQGYVEVYRETLAWVPGKGLLLDSRRRCGVGGQARIVKLARLDGALLHEHRSGLLKQARTYLALGLKPATSGGASGAEDEMVPAELAFPNVLPSVALLREVLAELEPLVAAAKAGGGRRSEPSEPKKGK